MDTLPVALVMCCLLLGGTTLQLRKCLTNKPQNKTLKKHRTQAESHIAAENWEQDQDTIRLNTTRFHLFTKQYVSTDLGHLQFHDSYFAIHIKERIKSMKFDKNF
jgi:hypothetical protein